LPFFGLSIGLGLVIYWLERNHVGARGPDWALSFPERVLIAGRALWFYIGKLLSPAGLCFIYPRWELNVHSARQWLFPLSAIAVAGCLWLFRHRIGRGPLTATLFYAGTLFPVLGFMNGYFMKYSFVCDHWSYLSTLGPIALGAALVTGLARRLKSKLMLPVFAIFLLPSLALLTHRQSGIFRDSETLYRVTLARNANADLAHNNLGLLLFQAGQLDEAIAHFEAAVRIRPSSAHAHNNLANALRSAGREREAVAHYEASLRTEPNNVSTLNNLALLLASSWDASLRDGRRALELAQRANQLTGGRSALTLCALGAAYAESGRFADAIAAAKRARQFVNPNTPLAPLLEQQIMLYQSGSPFHEPPP
jgi:tetratricopeptide (TPR) repeat protein